MGKPVLLLRLEGPLQSWGTRSRWDVRDTAPEPTKSGIVGLLGCALGYPMGDERLQVLDERLSFGVRVEAPGSIISDYQTITDFLPTAAGEWKGRGSRKKSPADLRAEGDLPATIISPRAYLEDAAFLAALEERGGNGPQVLEACALAVQRPKWPLFLGRKACAPTRPVFEHFGAEYDSVEDALRRHPWSWLGARKIERRQLPGEKLAAFIEDEAGDLQRQDALRLNAGRVYAFRRARREFFDPVLEGVPAGTPASTSGAPAVGGDRWSASGYLDELDNLEEGEDVPVKA